MDSTLIRDAALRPSVLSLPVVPLSGPARLRTVGVDVPVAQETSALVPAQAYAPQTDAPKAVVSLADAGALGAHDALMAGIAVRSFLARNDVQGPPPRGTPV